MFNITTISRKPSTDVHTQSFADALYHLALELRVTDINDVTPNRNGTVRIVSRRTREVSLYVFFDGAFYLHARHPYFK